jgi:hypothetical protein
VKNTAASAALLLAAFAIFVVSTRSSFADGMDVQKRYHHRRTVWVEPPPYEVCRVGWWQTLHWGHVRPRWGARCYGPVAYRY